MNLHQRGLEDNWRVTGNLILLEAVFCPDRDSYEEMSNEWFSSTDTLFLKSPPQLIVKQIPEYTCLTGKWIFLLVEISLFWGEAKPKNHLTVTRGMKFYIRSWRVLFCLPLSPSQGNKFINSLEMDSLMAKRRGIEFQVYHMTRESEWPGIGCRLNHQLLANRMQI